MLLLGMCQPDGRPSMAATGAAMGAPDRDDTQTAARVAVHRRRARGGSRWKWRASGSGGNESLSRGAGVTGSPSGADKTTLTTDRGSSVELTVGRGGWE